MRAARANKVERLRVERHPVRLDQTFASGTHPGSGPMPIPGLVFPHGDRSRITDAPDLLVMHRTVFRMVSADGGPAAASEPAVRTGRSSPVAYQETTAQSFPLFLGDGPEAKDIWQGELGDCWLLAALIAVLNVPGGKQVVKNMFTESANGITVKFFDPATLKSTSVTVSRKLPVRTGAGGPLSDPASGMVTGAQAAPGTFAYALSGAAATSDGPGSPRAIWPAILEKAIASHFQGYEKMQSKPAETAFRMILPASLTNKVQKPDPTVSIKDWITKMLKADRPVTVGLLIPQAGGHNYAVAEHDDTTVTLRDPRTRPEDLAKTIDLQNANPPAGVPPGKLKLTWDALANLHPEASAAGPTCKPK